MRRLDFLRVGGLLGLGGVLSSFTRPADAASLDEVLATKIKTAGLTGSAYDFSVAPISRVRIAVFGLGNRGQSLIDMLNWLVQEGHAEITAISDINPTKISRAQQQIANSKNQHLGSSPARRTPGWRPCRTTWRTWP